MHKRLLFLSGHVFKLLNQYTLPLVVLIITISIGLAYRYLSNAAATITNENSQLSAKRYLEALAAFRTLYTSEVINTASEHGLEISHDYKNRKNAIPLPATLSMTLGKAIGKHHSGAKTFLYSPYPFPWRVEESRQLFTQSFAKDAWQHLTRDPGTPYYRFENIGGHMSIRYAVADIMRPACIDCHNKHPQSPKNDWQAGEVRGIMEVVLPINIDQSQTQTQSSLQAAFIVLSSMASVVCLVLFIFFTRIKRDAYQLRLANRKLLHQQKKTKKANEKISAAHEKLQLQTAELRQSNQIKSDFLATMSHEIRTPINGVIGMLSLLKQSTLSPTQGHYAKLAGASADSLLGLINDILDFSKIEAGKLEIEMLDFNLPDLISSLAGTMAHKAGEKNIEIITDITQINETTVKGDPGRLRQVLSNLLGNAVKFTDQGQITIRARLDKINEEDIWLHCSISDTGIGIAADKIDAMFDRFTQADSSTTRQYGGSGLGLAIVRKLCELMHGEISVTSEYGKGSRFNFSIKLQHASDAGMRLPEAASQQLKSQSLPSDMRILLVEDNLINQMVASGILRNLGVKADTVINGQEAIQCLEQKSYDVVLMDCQMPVMDGYTTTRKIRQSTADYQDVYIIAMTANAMIGDREACLIAGMNEYLSKPIMVTELEQKLLAAMKAIKGEPAMSTKADS